MLHSALDGVTVLEFGQMIAGPYCGMLLGDMGAEVIKIEHPDRPDIIRKSTPKLGEESYPYVMLNRNKRGVAIDLSKPEAAAVVRRLVEKADVVITGFRPGAMERLGLGYEQMREWNPRIINCCLSGFGTTGPYRSRGGFDQIAQAMSGMMAITGDPDAPPARCGYPVLDVATALTATTAILGALVARGRTGVGEKVEVSLLETGLACSIWQSARYFAAGEVSASYGPGIPSIMAPYRAFKASDGYVVIAIAGREQWHRACDILGLPEELRDDESLATPSGRYHQRDRIIPAIEERMRTKSMDEWVPAFAEAGITVGPVNTIDRVLNDPHVLEREPFLEVEHPAAGTVRTLAPPFKSFSSQCQVNRQPPRLGEHTREILAELGVSDDELDRLERGGTIRSERAP